MNVETQRQLSEEWELYRHASQASVKHLALYHLIRCHILSHQVTGETPVSPRELRVIPRRHDAPWVAFLGCFTDPTREYVLPLKIGINRVGLDSRWGDYIYSPDVAHIMEGRQWLVVCQRSGAIVADDHSTNGSVVLDLNSPDTFKIRHPFPLRNLQNPKLDHIELDWNGDIVASLVEKTVIVNNYAGFVFGTVPTISNQG